MATNLPATLPNIAEIVQGHDNAFNLYLQAFDKIEAAEMAIRDAYAEIERVTPGARFHDERDGNEVSAFHKAVQLPARENYLSTARKLLTLRSWHYVVDRCGMRQLMDAQAKRGLDSQLRYIPDRTRGRTGRDLIDDDEIAKGPPPFTVETVTATLARFAGESEMIWRRGVANAFSSFDRRFRSHDGFKVGSRVILNHMVDSGGHFSTYGRAADLFRDIERAFQILDGCNPLDARSDFLHQVEQERRKAGFGYKPGQSEHVGEYFKVRIFMNGNAHLWFTRKDLVVKVNKTLAEHYGEVIGDAQAQEVDPLESRALTPARLHGFYPTPSDLVERIVRQVPYSETPLRLLEPSAGTGNFAYQLAATVERRNEDPVTHKVDAVEIQPKLVDDLIKSGKLNRVMCADFLKLEPSNLGGLYDGIVMNPPFDRERDIDHVSHALKFLTPDGWLLAIMSAGTEFRETKKSAAFRKLLDSRSGWMVDLPAGSFASVGTNVNTVLVGVGMRKVWW